MKPRLPRRISRVVAQGNGHWYWWQPANSVWREISKRTGILAIKETSRLLTAILDRNGSNSGDHERPGLRAADKPDQFGLNDPLKTRHRKSWMSTPRLVQRRLWLAFQETRI